MVLAVAILKLVQEMKLPDISSCHFEYKDPVWQGMAIIKIEEESLNNQ